MKKTVTQIDCPKEWESYNDWDSHRGLIYLCLKNAKNIRGSVLELGCGPGSTDLIKEYCAENQYWSENGRVYGRHFFSYETNPKWGEKMPNTILTDNYNTPISFHFENVITFIDCAPAEIRKELISSYEPVSKVIIVHDTEPGAEYVYHMNEILSTFKYRLDYQPEGKPHTTAVSNIIDVTKWI